MCIKTKQFLSERGNITPLFNDYYSHYKVFVNKCQQPFSGTNHVQTSVYVIIFIFETTKYLISLVIPVLYFAVQMNTFSISQSELIHCLDSSLFFAMHHGYLVVVPPKKCSLYSHSNYLRLCSKRSRNMSCSCPILS